MVKRKSQNVSLTDSGGGDSAPSSLGGSAVPSPASIQAPDDDTQEKPIFKAPDFQHTSKSSNKKRAWRSLKQIIHQERALQWPEDHVHYTSIDAPPSFKPSKKYSDISGLQAKYTDPQTKLYFARSSEFDSIRYMPNDIISGYLTLRKASNPVG